MSGKRAPGRGSQLTPADRAEIQRLHFVEGLNISEIARKTSRDRGTIAIVIRADDSQVLAKELEGAHAEDAIATLKKAANTVATDWVRASAKGADKGDHRAARDLLLHMHVIEPIETSRTSVGVQVVLNGGPAPSELSRAKVEAESEGPRDQAVIEVSPVMSTTCSAVSPTHVSTSTAERLVGAAHEPTV